MSMDEINLDKLRESEGAPGPKKVKDRTFILVAGILGAIMVSALFLLVIYAMVIAPRRRAAESAQLAEIYLQNTQVVLGGQLTAAASKWTATPSGMQTAIPETATPSDGVIQEEQSAATVTRTGVKVEPISTLKPTAMPATPVPKSDVSAFPVPDTYTLQSGEFPYCIARRFDIAPSALLSANNLTSTSAISAGTVLTIPQDAPAYNLGERSILAHPTTYVVQSGDTVNSIACQFGDVDPRNIEAANNLSGDYTLSVGQSIQIP